MVGVTFPWFLMLVIWVRMVGNIMVESGGGDGCLCVVSCNPSPGNPLTVCEIRRVKSCDLILSCVKSEIRKRGGGQDV